MDRIYQQLIRMFAAVLCVVVVLVETEWERLMAMMRILEFWVMRGLLQVRPVSLTCSRYDPFPVSFILCSAAAVFHTVNQHLYVSFS
jgi:hypothetical protein